MALREAILLLLTVVPFVPAQLNGSLRLADGGVSRCGRVEVFYDGRWGTIRGDDGWNTFAGDVVCQRLGYTGAQSVFKNAYYGEGQDPTWLFNLTCLTDSSSILECTQNGWGIGTSNHSQDAGVCCDCPQIRHLSTLPIRLSCPKCNEGSTCNTFPDKGHPNSRDCMPQVAVRGIVEVLVDGEWGTISAEGWGLNEAKVVCGELGYPMVYPPNQQMVYPPNQQLPSIADIWPNYNSEEGSGTQCCPQDIDQTESLRGRLGHTFIQGVKCSGNEALLLNCTLLRVGKCLDTSPNMSHQVATVQCVYDAHTDCRHISSETYRLRGGAVPWKGRVEVKMNGQWGTVCDTGFDTKEGNIICRRLGYGTAKKVKGRAGYGRGVGKIHLTQLRCAGSEIRLENCDRIAGRAAQSCGHEGDVGIECHVPDMSECIGKSVTYQVRMHKARDSQNSVITRSYPEVLGSAGWGMLCYSEKPMVTTLVGEVICRQAEQLFLSKISRGNRPSEYSGLIYYSGEVNCTGDEELLSNCSIDVSPSSWCPDKYTIVDCTPAVPDLVPNLNHFRRSLHARYRVNILQLHYLRCAKEEGCLSSSAEGADNCSIRYLLRFDSLTMNYGLHDFLPVLPKEDWLWHSCHNHYHSMEAFVEYDLLNTATGEKVAEGHKASYCLEDSICTHGTNTHFRCYLSNQGISVNCGDLYGSDLECQWIDITDVPGGEYTVRQRVNPQRLAVESDYKNNEITCKISLQSNRYFYTTSGCWLSDH